MLEGVKADPPQLGCCVIAEKPRHERMRCLVQRDDELLRVSPTWMRRRARLACELPRRFCVDRQTVASSVAEELTRSPCTDDVQTYLRLRKQAYPKHKTMAA